MAFQPNRPTQSPDQLSGRSRLLGVPMGGFGFIPSVVLALAAGFFSFFVVTFLAIAGIAIYNALGHSLNYADSYKFISFPAGCLSMILSFAYFGTLWARSKISGR